MNQLSNTFIQECLKYHQFSDYDSERDSSSDCRSELDDEYYQIIEKPTPTDELRRNTINPFYERCDSSNVVDDDSYINEDTAIQVDGDDKLIQTSNNVVERDWHKQKKGRQNVRQKKIQESQQTSKGLCSNNVYSCLLNNEDSEIEEENEPQKEDKINDKNVELTDCKQISMSQSNRVQKNECLDENKTSIQLNSNHKEGVAKETKSTQTQVTGNKKKKKQKKKKKKEAKINSSATVNDGINEDDEIDVQCIKGADHPPVDTSVAVTAKLSKLGLRKKPCPPLQPRNKNASAISRFGFVPCENVFQLGDMLSNNSPVSGCCCPGARSVLLAIKRKRKVMQTTNNAANHVPTSTNKNKETGRTQTIRTENEKTLAWSADTRETYSRNSNVFSRSVEKMPKEKFYDTDNAHSWRASPNIINWLSFTIVRFDLKSEEDGANSKQHTKNHVFLPDHQQLRIFPILHQMPTIIPMEDDDLVVPAFARLYREFSTEVVNSFVSNMDTLNKGELVQEFRKLFTKSPYALTLMRTELQMFGLNVPVRGLFGVKLEFEVYPFGVWLNIEASENLKYFKSRFRIVCK